MVKNIISKKQLKNAVFGAQQMESDLNGKISKLYIYAGTSWDEKRCVCAYDHGWSKQPETRAAKAISNEIIAMYN